jgi:patatin-related protein
VNGTTDARATTAGPATPSPQSFRIPGNAETEDLRLGLVMNGGVSLAVWMGGVTLEIDRAVRRQSLYAPLLRKLRRSFRVDVIAGASAGGLNGALLGMAMAHGNSLECLRSLWLNEAAFDRLLRPALKPNPPSLLMGDDYFLPALIRALGKLSVGQPADSAAVPVDLTITTTLVNGEPILFEDDFGTVLTEVEHRGELRFVRNAETGRDDFSDTPTAAPGQAVHRLALAARSSSSFPVAFEPSFIPINANATDDNHPDLAEQANFTSSRYVLDGGVLVNKPFHPMLRAVFDQPAIGPVARVVAYVVPSPGPAGPDRPDPRSAMPDVRTVVSSGMSTLPRSETIARDLQDLKDHNRRVATERQLRESLLTAVQFDRLSETLQAQYRDATSNRAVNGIMPTLVGRMRALWVRAAGSQPQEPARPPLPSAFEGALLVELRRRVAAFVRRNDELAWSWDADSVEFQGVIVLGLLSKARDVLPLYRRLDGLRKALGTQRERVHRALAEVREVRLRGRQLWADAGSDLMATATLEDRKARAEVRAWARRNMGAWMKTLTPLVGAAHEIAHVLVELAPVVEFLETGVYHEVMGTTGAEQPGEGESTDAPTTVLPAPRTQVAPPASGAGSTSSPGDQTYSTMDLSAIGSVAEALRNFVRPGSENDQRAPFDRAIQRLRFSAVQQIAFSGGSPPLEQRLQFIQISGYTPNAFDLRARPEDKLAGVQLSHFGAFYKQVWRANDWMWGRLDGAMRLTEMLVGPARMVRVFRGLSLEDRKGKVPLEAAWQWIEHELVLPPRDDPAHVILWRYWAMEKKAARREVKRAFSVEGSSAESAPSVLPMCTRAVARRLQLEILCEELPNVASAARQDGANGTFMSSSAQTFLQVAASIKAGDHIPPDQAIQLFSECRFGEELITDDIGSDLFTRTASQAAAVGASAFYGEHSGLTKGKGLSPVKPLLRTIRGLAMLLYVMARNATSSMRTGFAVLMAMLAVGGALIANAVVSHAGVFNPVTMVGIALVLAGLILATMRAGALRVLGLILVVAVVGIVPFVWASHYRQTAGWRHIVHRLAPLAPVVAMVAGSMALGLVSRSTGWLRRRRPR